MNIEEFRDYCLSFEGVSERMPFTHITDSYSHNLLVFYVGDKWFAFVNVDVLISAIFVPFPANLPS